MVVSRYFIPSIPPVHPAVSPQTHLVPALETFFKSFPASLGPSTFTLEAFKNYYETTEPFVDRLWTFLPVIYSAHFTFYPHYASGGSASVSSLDFSWLFGKKVVEGSSLGGKDLKEAVLPKGVDPRMALLFGLQVCWMLRLSFNTLRRGLFSFSGEDYRWEVLRAKIPKWQMSVINFFFIAFYQNILLMVTALPQYLLLTSLPARHPTHAPPPLGTADFVIAGIFLATLTVEMIADNQQQAYQNFKHGSTREGAAGQNKPKTAGAMLVDEGRMKRGFVTDGLWAWSRHPNFACEQTTWYILYAYTIRVTAPPSLFATLYNTFLSFATSSSSFSADLPLLIETLRSALPHLFNYSILSPLLMSLLFEASTAFTESISAGKYPLYRQYQRRVAMFWWPGTLFNGIWLAVTGEREKVDEDVFGKVTVGSLKKVEGKKNQ